MKKRVISIAATALAMALCLGIGAFSASNNEAISALLNREVKIVYNGVEQHFTDAAGNAVYPISYNNTTYLPVRAVSNLMNLPIEFDSASYAVVLGTTEVAPSDLIKLNNSGSTDVSHIIKDASELTVATADGGEKTYASGVFYEIWNSFASSSDAFAVMFDIKGYEVVTFTAWSDIDATVVVYDQDGAVFDQFDIPANTPTLKTLTLNPNMTGIAFAADSQGWDSGAMKILDAAVK